VKDRREGCFWKVVSLAKSQRIEISESGLEIARDFSELE
jgi:hypothetical protein